LQGLIKRKQFCRINSRTLHLRFHVWPNILHEIGHKDADGNVTWGAIRMNNSHGNLIHGHGIRVSVHNVYDLLIVANGNEVMILPRGSSQKVRDFATD